MYRRASYFLIGTAATIFICGYIVAVAYDRPLVEPEGKLLGPSLTWLLELMGVEPTNATLLAGILLIDMLFRAVTILAAALLVDLVVRAGYLKAIAAFKASRRGTPPETRTVREMVSERWNTHWTRDRMRLVVIGMVCFYITYVCYRNLKSNLPFVRPDPDRAPGEVKALLFDRELHVMDRVLFFRHDPSDVLHGIFGTEFSAYVLSQIYVTFLPLVMLMVIAWLIWSRNVRYGYWFVTSQSIAWALGTLSYYLLPTLGPGIQYPSEYADLVSTPTGELMESIANGRSAFLYDPTVTDSLNSVAGFASLHCGITLLWALSVQYTIRSRVLHWIFWVNFGLTVIATIYFGWHYVADDIAGIAIAVIAFYLGGVAIGKKWDFSRAPEKQDDSPDPKPAEGASADALNLH